MTDPFSFARPSWVHKRDGRQVPFDADRISHDLFAATEAQGQPNAFLARELTDSVLYFLSLESEGAVPSTKQIAELIVKVVRELGHPELSASFAFRESRLSSRPPKPTETRSGPSLEDLQHQLTTTSNPTDLAWQLSGACLRAYSLKAVFAPDLVAANADGLIHLGNLETPLELANVTLPPSRSPGASLIERIIGARRLAGEAVILDGPEHTLQDAPDIEDAVEKYCRELRLGLEVTGLRAIVNLNCATPPPGTGELAEGPLFAPERPATDANHRRLATDLLLDHLPTANARLRIDWHLTPHDLTDEVRVLRLSRRLLEGAPLGFVFDRARRPISLAEGIDRRNPATLFAIGLNLPRLAEQAGTRAVEESFLKKLGSLVRLAHSGAPSKREFLRRHGRPELRQGFLLDRSRLVLVPLGLEAAVQMILDRPIETDGPGIAFAGQVLAMLRHAAQMESRTRHLEAILDAGSFAQETSPGSNPLLEQMRIGAQLAAGMPTVDLYLPADKVVEAEEIAELLRRASQQPEIVRLRFIRPSGDQQAAGLWEE